MRTVQTFPLSRAPPPPLPNTKNKLMHIMPLLATMAFRTVASFRSSSSSSSFGGASSNMRRMIRPSSYHDATTIRRLFSNNNSSSARYSVVESDGDYESMTVSELRELLRNRGLMVSGIKAQLVERLGTGTVNPRKVGNSRPMEKNTITTTPPTTTRPKKTMMATSSSATKEKERWTNSTGERRERKRNERPTPGEITTTTVDTDDHGAVMNSRARRDERRRTPTTKNDNVVPPPFTVEKRMQDPTDEIIHDLKERIHDLNRQSGASNLVFAMDGEEESDDEWDSDDEDIVSFDSNGLEFDESDDYFDDPNETNNAPPPIGNRPPGRTVETATTTTTPTFKEDFQGTRVFVQGLPVEAHGKILKITSSDLYQMLMLSLHQ